MTLSNRANRINNRESSPSQPSLDALLSLADDSDLEVSTLAIEQLLTRPDLPELIAANQDSDDATRRRRMHQLTVIISRADRRREFLSKLLHSSESVWDALIFLDMLYDTQSSRNFIEDKIAALQQQFNSRQPITLNRLGEFMQKNNFSMPKVNFWSFGFFLLGDVLENHDGMPTILAAIARAIVMPSGLQLKYCLMAGKLCLIDSKHNILDPMMGWKITSNAEPQLYHICTESQVISLILSHLFAVSVITWSPRDIYAYGALLAKMSDSDLSDMPYPLGMQGKAGNRTSDRSPVKK